jgi:presenilin-like A22 family membrane protease
MDKTLQLILLYLCAMLIGVLVLPTYIDFKQTAQTGETTINTGAYIVDPVIPENETSSAFTLIVGVLIATGLILLLIKYNVMWLMKAWMTLSFATALFIAFYGLLVHLPGRLILSILIALAIAIGAVILKNRMTHTISQLFIYAGIAALFVPIINVLGATILLAIMCVYDVWMVNHSKQMVTLAQSQIKEKLFAGIVVGEPSPTPSKATGKRTAAIVGGGDIAFPLIFAGAAMKHTGSIWTGVFCVVGATIGLSVLFWLGSRGRYHPAMPAVSGGVMLGFVLAILLL